jgi:hypothetical protein
MTKECHPVSRQSSGQSTGTLKPGFLGNNARRVVRGFGNIPDRILALGRLPLAALWSTSEKLVS